MKTIEVKLYQFEELSDKAKTMARDWYRSCGLDYEWWETTYEDGLHHVILSLPAGMDIAPDCWRFEKQGFAERRFMAVCKQLESKGFNCVQEGDL